MTNAITLAITDRRPFADGIAFGTAGAYERLTGRAHFAVDPGAPANAWVVDLDKAPRDAQGNVRFAADIMILAPADQARGNRRVFYDYGNRGHKRMLQFFNDAAHSNDPLTPAHAGNGFLMRRGYTVAWCAWEGDLLPGDGRAILDVPVATDGGHADHRQSARRIHRRSARHHHAAAQRQGRGAFLPNASRATRARPA